MSISAPIHNNRDPSQPAKPRHASRATRSEGRRTRSLLLDAASALFRARGLANVSVAEIAAAADTFPSQITYYFALKEALFVEAACREVLRLASHAEAAAALQATPSRYTRALVESVMRGDALAFFVEAMVLTRRRADLGVLVARTIERLETEGLRAYAHEIFRRGWSSRAEPATTARRFWAIAIGVTVEGQATGRSADHCVADMLRLIGDQADGDISTEQHA